MKILFGIIFFYVLVIMRSRMSQEEDAPYGSVIIITLFLVAFVAVMLYTMETPEP